MIGVIAVAMLEERRHRNGGRAEEDFREAGDILYSDLIGSYMSLTTL